MTSELFTYPDRDTLPLWCAIEIDGLEDEADDMAAEIAALREFVVADDAYEWAIEAAMTLEDFDRCSELLNQKEAARRRLADEYGLPLPEVER